ncbi:MAG: hypothetical protein SFU91_08280 [Chloroherpetonaceae bacterium]|nr:hypothetical protein [Chloroherpetonaceae bacterium]
MKVIIDIPDRDAKFALKVLNSLSFIKKTKPLSSAAIELWEELNQATDEVRLHKQGKIKLKTAQEIINEL